MEVGYGQVYVIEFIAKVTSWNKLFATEQARACKKQKCVISEKSRQFK